MEHRTNERLDIDLLANVSRNGRKLGVFKVKDIGNGGAALVDEAGELCLYDFIKVTLISPDKALKGSPPLYALIVQNDGQCVGAMWAVGPVDIRYLLKRLLPLAA